ncbi:MAG TPA: DUF262 domain-containing protein [Solirubrobacterales bacterium]|nr:DUF262 domain-containing protein [Solirubrobacterales bacterium]
MEIGHERLVKLVERLLGGEIVLPDIQRDFVWAGSKIPRLLDSLYREWPVGSILLWHTELEIPIKSAAIVQGAPIGVRPSILLDGQQRMTTLARVMAPDRVPEGQRPPDVRFHPGSREFKTANAVQAKNPAWISVSSILADGAQFRQLLKPLALDKEHEDEWYEVLSDVARRIRDYHLPVQTVTIDDYEQVAEIFNRVNTGGRPLSKGDLVMGVLAARWTGKPARDGQPEVKGGRRHIEEFEESLAAKNWPINREVLFRIMSSLSLGSPNHIRLLELKGEEQWRDAWERTALAVSHAVGFLKDDAGIPVRSLLPTEYVLLLPAVLLEGTNGAFASPQERDALVRWVLLASAFGHYSGSLETTLAADINTCRAQEDDMLDTLLRSAQEPRSPDVGLSEEDLDGKTQRSPLRKLLQIAALANEAKSWWSHRSITYDPESKGMAVENHHIFPRNWLKQNGLGDHPDLDTLANLAFLSKHDNIKISDGDPVEYLEQADPQELETQWVPTDPDLWRAERFGAFCAERRRLLAAALNDLLGLQQAPVELEPLDADETPEPEAGAWAEAPLPR